MPTTLRLPYDIYFGTTGADCADPDGRMHLARRVQRDPTAGRETTHVFDLLGNASTALALPATRGTAYPAAALVWDGPRAGTVSIGTREPVPVDAWLRKGSRCVRACAQCHGADVSAVGVHSWRATAARTVGRTPSARARGSVSTTLGSSWLRAPTTSTARSHSTKHARI
jgi:hypothetical protein